MTFKRCDKHGGYGHPSLCEICNNESSRSDSDSAPTDNGIEELDELCEQYNSGEIDITKLVCNIWNRAVYVGSKTPNP
ncbi:MAG: hypothetical protein IME93_03040 [Proteobacteria bacterium]|nr:hypothetical protein [Pseudomonadota bacterium]